MLLILAGVTVNLTLQDGGIFSRAQLAAQNYADAQEKELVELEQFDTEINDTINNVSLRITDKEELKDFAKKVNEGKTFVGETIVLWEDIDLGNEVWIPIGTKEKPFSGTFDGEGHTISNLTTDAEKEYQGLFGVSTGTIKNIGIESGEVKGRNYVGGIVAYTSGKIENCYNKANVIGKSIEMNLAEGLRTGRIGGIVGYVSGEGGYVYRCYNEGDISVIDDNSSERVYGAFVGGICGCNYGTTELCMNSGKIDLTSRNINSMVGGITGDGGDVSNCYNSGDINSMCGSVINCGDSCCGGVIGQTGGIVFRCFNIGKVGSTHTEHSSRTGIVVGGLINGECSECYGLKCDDYKIIGEIVGGGFTETDSEGHSFVVDSDSILKEKFFERLRIRMFG